MIFENKVFPRNATFLQKIMVMLTFLNSPLEFREAKL